MEERQTIEVDLACVGFGPAVGGFLATLSAAIAENPDAFESKALPGMPLQVICYERADDIGFAVSGVLTKAESIRKSFPDLKTDDIPFATKVTSEKLLYLLDPHGASRRSRALGLFDGFIRATGALNPWYRSLALEIPYIPPFLRKEGGLLLSIGQFNQWVGSRVMASGCVQIWPGTPVDSPIFDGDRVCGLRLVDQGVDKSGKPDAGYMPGMNVKAALTVVGDGPVGTVGQKLDRRLGLPEGHRQRDWAVGMKMLLELPEDSKLEPGTVIHTVGYPEPEIFGFLYVYKGGLASCGIFVPSWFESPVRTSYRYLQHWLLHPYLRSRLEGARLRSWGAKSIQESGRRGEPYLVGDGFARIGEGSGSTNVLSGSGVDEAWSTGVMLAEGVLELLEKGETFTKANLEGTYVKRRRESRLERELRVAEKSRDGFQKGFVRGMLGMALSGLSGGRINLKARIRPPQEHIASLEAYFKGRIPPEELDRLRVEAEKSGASLHDALMDRAGWPPIDYDGKLLLSHQDALLVGGKVQAPAGYADHVVFLYPEICKSCREKVCVELCSAQAITYGEDGQVPTFDREKCVHCGVCFWNCSKTHPEDPERRVIDFRAGAGGLHSAEN